MLLFSASAVRRNRISKPLVACTSDNVVLLFLCKAYELNGISGNTDREVRILGLLRMSLAVKQLLCTEDVDVEVMSTIIKVAVRLSLRRKKVKRRERKACKLLFRQE